MTALELGCGAAQNTLHLARKGLRCTALDVSRAQLRHAQKLAQAENLAPTFLHGPIEHFPRLLADKTPFDFIHSSHAFEFVDDPCACVANAARFLKPGGAFMLSTVHPVYNGEWLELEDDGWGRFLKNYFLPEDDCRDDFGNVKIRSRAYPVSAWFGWLRGAGLEITQLLEPRALFKRAPYTSKDWAANAHGELDAIPSTIIFLAEKNCAPG
jgi:SAM-dependent methyltransferase